MNGAENNNQSSATLDEIFMTLRSCNDLIAEIEAYGQRFPEYSLQMIAASFDSLMGNDILASNLDAEESALIYLRAAENQAAIYLIDEVYLASVIEIKLMLDEYKIQSDESDDFQAGFEETQEKIAKLHDIQDVEETDLEYLQVYIENPDKMKSYWDATSELLKCAEAVYVKAERLRPMCERKRNYALRDEPTEIINKSSGKWKIVLACSITALIVRIYAAVLSVFSC